MAVIETGNWELGTGNLRIKNCNKKLGEIALPAFQPKAAADMLCMLMNLWIKGFVTRSVWMLLIFFCFAPGGQGMASEKKIPRNLVLMPDNGSAIVIDKSKQKFYLYSSENGEYHQKFVFPCSTGESSGIKSRAGDKKTPEGIYFLTDEYEDRYLSPVYGRKAFPTDYPNFLDKRAGRNGSAIWIHGTNKNLKPMDSNGCVAMNNSDILSAADYIALNQTPVIIVDKVIYQDDKEIELCRNKLLKLVDLWVDAVETGDYHDYLNLYGSEYLPPVSWWTKWMKYRNQVKKNGAFFSFFRDLSGIYMEKDIFVIDFNLGLELNKNSMEIGRKKFFIREHGDGYRITGDMFGTLAKGVTEKQEPLLFAAGKLFKDSGAGSPVRAFVAAWLKAWSSKDMKKYGDCYSENFYSDGMGKKIWVKRKTWLAEKYSFIDVSAEDLKIEKGKTKSVVTFLQFYRASGFSAKGVKKLMLVKKEGVWKITQESWKKR
ncbi:MAG: L,D-transpeptidase family protein [Thermodesulfobacteriota bacterium]|nr:L,D-transpeptidase family protein [Thermodesulfobacteriota bacterium]